MNSLFLCGVLSACMPLNADGSEAKCMPLYSVPEGGFCTDTESCVDGTFCNDNGNDWGICATPGSVPPGAPCDVESNTCGKTQNCTCNNNGTYTCNTYSTIAAEGSGKAYQKFGKCIIDKCGNYDGSCWGHKCKSEICDYFGLVNTAAYHWTILDNPTCSYGQWAEIFSSLNGYNFDGFVTCPPIKPL